MGEAKTRDRRASRAVHVVPADEHEAQEAALRHTGPEPMWTLFRVVFALSALSWGGLALMAQLALHYV